jgi:hypothetical protein
VSAKYHCLASSWRGAWLPRRPEVIPLALAFWLFAQYCRHTMEPLLPTTASRPLLPKLSSLNFDSPIRIPNFFSTSRRARQCRTLEGRIGPSPAQLIENVWGRKRSEAALFPGTAITITLSPSRVGMEAHVGLVQKIVNSAGDVVLGPSGC